MLWERMLPGTLLMWGITKTGKMAINCHPPSSAESLPTCFRYPGQPPSKAEHVPSHALTESCENKARLVLNLKLQVSSPEEVIKNLAHVPMRMLLSPCPGGPMALLSLALSGWYPSCPPLSQTLSVSPSTQVSSHESLDPTRNGKKDTCAAGVPGG